MHNGHIIRISGGNYEEGTIGMSRHNEYDRNLLCNPPHGDFSLIEYTNFGCSDSTALNYIPYVLNKDDSCLYEADLNFDGLVSVQDVIILIVKFLKKLSPMNFILLLEILMVTVFLMCEISSKLLSSLWANSINRIQFLEIK
jgi:hypothetical protein